MILDIIVAALAAVALVLLLLFAVVMVALSFTVRPRQQSSWPRQARPCVGAGVGRWFRRG